MQLDQVSALTYTMSLMIFKAGRVTQPSHAGGEDDIKMMPRRFGHQVIRNDQTRANCINWAPMIALRCGVTASVACSFTSQTSGLQWVL